MLHIDVVGLSRTAVAPIVVRQCFDALNPSGFPKPRTHVDRRVGIPQFTLAVRRLRAEILRAYVIDARGRRKMNSNSIDQQIVVLGPTGVTFPARSASTMLGHSIAENVPVLAHLPSRSRWKTCPDNKW
jgi:hypothetical protein